MRRDWISRILQPRRQKTDKENFYLFHNLGTTGHTINDSRKIIFSTENNFSDVGARY